MTEETRDKEPSPADDLPTRFVREWGWITSIRSLVSMGAGLLLAIIFWSIPFTEFGKEIGEPWYFWVFMGLAAFAAVFFMGWVFYPPPKKKRKKVD